LALLRAAVLAVFLALAFAAPAAAKIAPGLTAPSIVINLPSRTLELFSAGELVKVYPVAIGKPSTPTPLGEFAVFEKVVDPVWYPPRTGEAVPSGPWNPLGYRWVGFYGLVGFHGTNAPEYIGQAVSNGCVRMREADVEEVFEVVQLGTPVRVTYERARVRVDRSGEVSLGVYPDVYGYGGAPAAEARERLAAHGLGWLAAEGEVAALVAAAEGRQVAVARVHACEVNGRVLPERAVTLRGATYVPLLPVAAALGAEVAWDAGSMLARGTKRTVPGRVMGDKVYVTAADAHALFGGQQVFREEENVLAVDVVALYFNGRPLAGDVQVVDGVLAVPVAAVAEAVGLKAVQAEDGTVLVAGARVPATLVGGVAYIQLTKVYDVFRAYVYWDREARSVELTYPFVEKGWSD
jgi:hypothetical protein